MKPEEWKQLVFSVAKEYPEYLNITFEAFSDGVKAQASDNREKVAKMGAALSMLISDPKEKRWIDLAKQRLIESRLFEGTEFAKKHLNNQSEV